MDDLRQAEFNALRHEILLRMAIQNLVLIVLMPLFLLTVLAGLDRPDAGGRIALGYIIASGMGSLFWLHSGARMIQIKAYLQTLGPAGAGWEAWLSRSSFEGRLGSRWLISTQGVFVGSQIAALLFVGVLFERNNIDWPIVVVGALGVAATAALMPHPRLRER